MLNRKASTPSRRCSWNGIAAMLQSLELGLSCITRHTFHSPYVLPLPPSPESASPQCLEAVCIDPFCTLRARDDDTDQRLVSVSWVSNCNLILSGRNSNAGCFVARAPVAGANNQERRPKNLVLRIRNGASEGPRLATARHWGFGAACHGAG